MPTIDVSGFKQAVSELLGQYGERCVEAAQGAAKETAKEGAKKLKHPPSPINEKGKKSGEYRKHWTSKTEESRIGVSAIIYGNKPTYRLAHLLEFGHALRQGGRSPAIEHIKPVEDWVNKEAVEKLRKKVEAI